MVMQLSVPNGPQPSQNPPLVQWNPCKYYSIEQRPSKPGELYKTDNTPQVHTTPHTCGWICKGSHRTSSHLCTCIHSLACLPPRGQRGEWECLQLAQWSLLVKWIDNMCVSVKSCYVIKSMVLMCHSVLYYSSLFFLSSCPGQYPADESPGLPHSVSHPVSLRQCQQRLSRPGTIAPHIPVSPARRTSSRYKWTRRVTVHTFIDVLHTDTTVLAMYATATYLQIFTISLHHFPPSWEGGNWPAVIGHTYKLI